MRQRNDKTQRTVTCEECISIREDLDEVPDCENCKNPVLWPINYEAWSIYCMIANKFVYDFHALPLVFDILKPEMTKREAIKLLEKLILIHSIITRHDEEDKKQ